MRRALVLSAVLILAPATARAEEGSAQSRAAAQALFDEAKQLVEKKQYAEACPKLEEVVRLQPKGIGAKIALAECYEGEDKLASAWTTYVMIEGAAQSAGQAARAKDAHLRAANLKATLSVLTIDVSPEAKASAGLAVTRDGVAVGAPQFGTHVPIDGGKHTIAATADGGRTWSTTVDIASSGGDQTVMIPALKDPAADAAAPARTAPRADSTAATSGSPTWAFVAGGAGVVLLAVGVGFGVDGSSAKSKLGDECPNLVCGKDVTDKDALNGRKDRGLALFLALGGAGAIALTAGVVGIVGASSKPKEKSARIEVLPFVSPSSGGAFVTGGF